MTPQDIDDLKQFPLRKFSKGEYIIRQGDPVGNAFFLIEGRCRRFTSSASGSELTYELHTPDYTTMSFIGVLATYRPDHLYQTSYVAEDDCLCLELSERDLQDHLNSHPHVYNELLRSAMAGYSLLEKYFKFKQEKNTPGQICTALYFNAQPNGATLRLPVGFSNSELARLTGANRVTVVRVMQELARRRIAENTDKGIRIINPEKLRALVYDEEKLEYLKP